MPGIWPRGAGEVDVELEARADFHIVGVLLRSFGWSAASVVAPVWKARQPSAEPPYLWVGIPLCIVLSKLWVGPTCSV